MLKKIILMILLTSLATISVEAQMRAFKRLVAAGPAKHLQLPEEFFYQLQYTQYQNNGVSPVFNSKK